jgi:hypothetical protein
MGLLEKSHILPIFDFSGKSNNEMLKELIIVSRYWQVIQIMADEDIEKVKAVLDNFCSLKSYKIMADGVLLVNFKKILAEMEIDENEV